MVTIKLKFLNESNLLEKLNQTVVHAKAASNNEVVMLMGMTAAGKTTLAYSLMGVPLQRAQHPQFPNKEIINTVANASSEYTGIGDAINSKTLFCSLYKTPDESIILGDCPGFEHNTNLLEQILTATSTLAVTEQAASIKLVVCLSYESMFTSGGSITRGTFNAFSKFFQNMEEHHQSIALIITQAHDNNGPISKNDILTALRNFSNNMINKNDRRLLEFFLRDNGSFVEVSHPLIHHSNEPDLINRRSILNLISSLRPLKKGENTFSPPFPLGAQNKITDDLSIILKLGIEVFTKYNEIIQRIDEENYLLNKTNEKHHRLRTILNDMSQGKVFSDIESIMLERKNESEICKEKRTTLEDSNKETQDKIDRIQATLNSNTALLKMILTPDFSKLKSVFFFLLNLGSEFLKTTDASKNKILLSLFLNITLKLAEKSSYWGDTRNTLQMKLSALKQRTKENELAIKELDAKIKVFTTNYDSVAQLKQKLSDINLLLADDKRELDERKTRLKDMEREIISVQSEIHENIVHFNFLINFVDITRIDERPELGNFRESMLSFRLVYTNYMINALFKLVFELCVSSINEAAPPPNQPPFIAAKL